MVVNILVAIVIVISIVFLYGVWKIITSFLKTHTDFYFGMFGIKRKKKNGP